MLLLALALATMPRQIAGNSDDDLAALSYVPLGRTSAAATRAELTVDAAGTPVHCEATAADGAPGLDRDACRFLLRRARFTPAIGSDGSPIAAVVRLDIAVSRITPRTKNAPAPPSKVDFAVQVDNLPPGAAAYVVDAVLTTDPAGRVTDCTVARSSTVAQLDRLACAQLQTTTFTPARDGADRPMHALRQVSVGFTVAGGSP